MYLNFKKSDTTERFIWARVMLWSIPCAFSVPHRQLFWGISRCFFCYLSYVPKYCALLLFFCFINCTFFYLTFMMGQDVSGSRSLVSLLEIIREWTQKQLSFRIYLENKHLQKSKCTFPRVRCRQTQRGLPKETIRSFFM